MILAFSDGWGFAAAAGAATAYAVLALATPRLSARALRGLLLAAWLLHALTLVEALLGTPPRFGFAPALSMTVWLVLTVYAVDRSFMPTGRWPGWAARRSFWPLFSREPATTSLLRPGCRCTGLWALPPTACLRRRSCMAG